MGKSAIRMARTALSILRRQGPLELLRAIGRKLRRPKSQSDKSSQHEVDIAFVFLRANQRRGVMVDVGAHYGGTLRRFAKAGWQVHAFEPDSENRKVLLEQGYGEMPNVNIDARAVSDKAGRNVPLYRSEESTGISGLSAFHPTHVRGETVEVTTLEVFMNEQSIEKIDFLKIDTEGFDLFVLKGFPWDRAHPQLILCEFEDRKTQPLGYTFHEMAGFLEQQGYKLIVSEWYPVKRYGIVHDWRRYVTYPCELADPKAWGNFFAVKETHYRALAAACGLD